MKNLKEFIEERNELDREHLSGPINSTYKGLIPRMDKRTYALRVIVSLDKFHLEAIDKLSPSDRAAARQQVKSNIEKLASLFPVEIDKMCNYTIYGEGRGKNILGTYKREVPLNEYALMYWKMKEGSGMRDYLIVGPIVGISYDGKIIETSKSYEFSDKHAIGDIHKESFFQMCKRLKDTKGFKQYRDVGPLYKAFDKILHRLSTSTKGFAKMQKFYKKSKTPINYSYFANTGVEGYEELSLYGNNIKKETQSVPQTSNEKTQIYNYRKTSKPSSGSGANESGYEMGSE